MTERGHIVTLGEVGGLEVRAQPAPWWHGVELFMRGRDVMQASGPLLVTGVVMEEQDDSLAVQPAVLGLGMKESQVLMDDLWASGVGPSDKHRDGEALGAVREHLGDMQKVAFRLLDDKLD